MDKTTTIEVGTRVYNRGDMCNPEHFGTITKIESDRWGTHIEITPDDGATLGYTDEPRKPYSVPVIMICHVDKGNGSTRIVTEAAYNALRGKQLA